MTGTKEYSGTWFSLLDIYTFLVETKRIELGDIKTLWSIWNDQEVFELACEELIKQWELSWKNEERA